MGKLFAEKFVAVHQRIGDFGRIPTPVGTVKVGGNVASYFCTTEGRVIHAVLGPVGAAKLLAEAKWAIDAYAPVAKSKLDRQKEHVAEQHASAAKKPPDILAENLFVGGDELLPGMSTAQIHDLLARHPLATLSEAYRYVFERLLGEPVSQEALAQLEQQEKKARGESEKEPSKERPKKPSSTSAGARPKTPPAGESASRPPADPEQAARRKLELAQRLVSVNLAEAKKWLREVVEEFPDTKAAKEAAVALEKLE